MRKMMFWIVLFTLGNYVFAQYSYKIDPVQTYLFPKIDGFFMGDSSYDIFVGGNLYFSKDEGNTFYPLLPHLAPSRGTGLANAVIRDKDNPHFIYMSFFNRWRGPSFAPFGRSLDDGKTLQFISDQFGGDVGGANLCQDSAGVLYIITTQMNLESFSLYRSYDKGSTWQKVEIKKGKKIWKDFFIDSLWPDPEIPYFLYAIFFRGTFNGWETVFMVSQDGGENWERREQGIPHNSRGYISFAYTPYIHTQSPRPPYRIYLINGNGYAYAEGHDHDNLVYSDNRGKKWHIIKMKKDKSQFEFVKVDPNNPFTLYAVSHSPLKHPFSPGFQKSIDGGKKWKNVGKLVNCPVCGEELTLLTYLALTKSGNILALGPYGVALSRDGGSTFNLQNDFFKPSVEELIKTQKGTIIALGRWLNLSSFDGGKSFKVTPGWATIREIGDGKLITGGNICEDSEDPVCYSYKCPVHSAGDFFWVPSLKRIIVIDSGANYEPLYFSDDYGETWSSVGTLPLSIDTHFYCRHIAVNNDNPQIWVVAGTIFDKMGLFESLDSTEGALFLSEDGGFTWGTILDRSQIGGVTSLRIDKCNGNILVISTVGLNEKGGVFVSEDFGRTWERRVEGLKGFETENGTLLSVVVSPVVNGVVYAAVNFNGGIYKSEDWGKHWTKISDNPVMFDEQFLHNFVYIGESPDHGTNFVAANVISMTDILPLEDEKESVLISTLSDGLFLLTRENEK